MNDQTLLELGGMACISGLAVAALVIDGSGGESLMAVISAALGAIVTHVYHVNKGEDEDAKEV